MCEKNGRILELCEGVLGTLDWHKGFHHQQLFDVKTHKLSSSRLVLKTGDYRKRGLAFNFCPFTGLNIETWLDDPESSKPDR